MKLKKSWVAAAAMLELSGAAQAAAVFQGRLADGTASATCTVTGPASARCSGTPRSTSRS